MADAAREKYPGPPPEHQRDHYPPHMMSPEGMAAYPPYSAMSAGMHIPTTNLHRSMMSSTSMSSRSARNEQRGNSPQTRSPSGNGDPYHPPTTEGYTPRTAPSASNGESYNARSTPTSSSPEACTSPAVSSSNNGVEAAKRSSPAEAKYKPAEPESPVGGGTGSFQSLLNMCNNFTSKNNMSRTHENLNTISKILSEASTEPVADFRNSFSHSGTPIPSGLGGDSRASPSTLGQSVPGTEGSNKRPAYANRAPPQEAAPAPKKKRKRAAPATQTATPPPVPPQMMQHYMNYAQYAAAMPPGLRDLHGLPQGYPPYGANMGSGTSKWQSPGTQLSVHTEWGDQQEGSM